MNPFQCGGELFKVPYWHLEKYSPIMMLRLPVAVSYADGTRGTSDDTAIPIDGIISKGEFVIFLDFFYRGFVTVNRKRWHRWLISCLSILRKEIPADEWCELLIISSKLGCKELRTRAIEELIAKKNGVLPVDRIKLGNKYEITQWLPEAYAHLFVREDHLTIREGEKLGLDITVKVLKGRDACKRNGWTSSENVHVTELVRGIFPPPNPPYTRRRRGGKR